jgi:5-oxopent-3-ene-1,2,5-tricarboxylate decarboxylase/2-hydroxyhepta-2,4-diene-1,7-dioate isomerase
MSSALPYPTTVYGVALNDQAMLDRMSESLTQPPYQKPPVAPILYIKTRNTFASQGASVPVPSDPGIVRIDAVIGKKASRVDAKTALDYVEGFLIVSDVTLPHDNYYRPAVRQRCRDQFCPMSITVARDEALKKGFNPDSADIAISINGIQVHSRALHTLVLPLSRLIADVTEFMTLLPGDVLLVGPPDAAPLARPDDHVRIDVAGLGSLEHRLVAETKEQ